MTLTDVRTLLDELAAITPAVRTELQSAANQGKTATENSSGDDQSVADLAINRLFRERLSPLNAVGAFASEECESVEETGERYSVAIDPLDGSSNLQSNNTVGTVIGVYDAPLPASGRNLIASAVLLYGPITTMTAAVDGTVTRYTIDCGDIVDSSSVTVPDAKQVCGFAGTTSEWAAPVRSFWRELNDECKLRYTGAMVGDIAHLLVDGGLLGYPERTVSPNGDLRLQYEVNPIAHLVETAGGRSSTGRGSPLDIQPDGLHQHVPAYFGTPATIDALEAHIESTNQTAE
ncbi:class 1 fructose-bisphosphatase [Natrialba aegyptia]|uniref:Fructose-1,6-bisphosphatase class 1 n=1 Tax=Natrialba aegyptia DSM 13077 TaxID=1227491 RepID=M0AIC9_9EURY|nr:class 1 fructose-bisphosphatase [Natrialba aegyptia]ELY97652.1 fructose-1,6-bisphosphatase [Natrialba aegyptia DSM 13077]